ncbi:ATP-binding protein [Streptomyces sp. NPDC001796]|uniref:ATP-binding protein n=1 Tax=Streptomyces sp. NPDC001796 TaxID=3364609 RepID=UPI0036C34A5B
MPRIVREPEGKDWQHRSRIPLFLRSYASHGWQHLTRIWNSARMYLVARRRVPNLRVWGMKWSGRSLWKCAAAVLAVLFLFWFALGVHALVVGYRRSLLASWCDGNMSCSIISSSLSPLLVVGFSTTIFLIAFYPRAAGKARRKAKRDPRSLVPTAGTIIEDVVGRHELCQVLTRALHDRKMRRPHILVGSIGAGKTAVLVQLTQMLAQKKAVPVPIRLRDVYQGDSSLDFAKAGQKRFCEMVDSDLATGQHGERVWRQLLTDERAVVIADGLEELFVEGNQQKERDIAIRNAIQLAEEQRLPLVIASRPHSPLEESDAAIIHLEPLSEEAALDYLVETSPAPDALRLDWLVETAVVSESPLYLQIARRLREHHRLEYLTHRKEWEDLDTRRADRWSLRLRLLDEWKYALIKGHLYENYALTARQRYETVEVVSALACAGLLDDTLEVGFSRLIDPAEGLTMQMGKAASSPVESQGNFPEIWNALKRRIANFSENPLPRGSDVSACRNVLSLYATQGEHLGLIETKGDKVRFHHSIIQAYLGARFLNEISDGRLVEALREPRPGREMLIALVLNSRMPAELQDAPMGSTPKWRIRQQSRRRGTVCLLRGVLKQRRDAKAFDMYAAALQIDRMDSETGRNSHLRIAKALLRHWNTVTVGDRQSINAAKENLVHRVGETVREISEASKDKRDPAYEKKPAYGQLLDIVLNEPMYPIRLAVAQEFGSSGDDAFEVLRQRFPLSGDEQQPPTDYDPWTQYQDRYRSVQREESLELDRLMRESARTGRSVDVTFRERERYYRDQKSKIRREYIARAWLVPMMVGSVTKKFRRQAGERVGLWLQHLDCDRPGADRAELPIILEISLAQGFKFAANRRRRHACANEETREFMVQHAEFMLARARYWYSQLTLIHALCLWELTDDPGQTAAGVGKDGSRRDASRIVGRWLGMAGSKRDPRSIKPGDITSEGRERLHPFVAEAAELAALAIETGHPERYIWIDEKGVMENVGSAPTNPHAARKHKLWISPAVGWSTLHPRAQQLLADVLLLLNLAEREGDPDEVDARLEKANQTILPPCLAKSREPLHPDRTVGRADDAPPGSMCMPDCPFEMCPYPAKGQQQRAEFPETFCRQQQSLLRPSRRWSRPLWWLQNPVRHRAAWQDTRKKELIRFWGDMALRSRTLRD